MLYFSGVAGPVEAAMLAQASVRHVLVDPKDLVHLPASAARVALDNGAYRAYKRGAALDIEAFLAAAHSRDFDFVVAPDVIGDPEATRALWRVYRRAHFRMIPVWQWGASDQDLHTYLDESQKVAIGGLVKAMREKDEAMLRRLVELASEHLQRFHVLGMNWLRAINELSPLVASSDTSKFLDAARYGHIIFRNTRTGLLSQAPAKALQGYYAKDLSARTTRCVLSAQALERFCNGPEPFGPPNGEL